MRCEELEAIVFSGREATAWEREAMREHAKACEACRALLENEAVLSGARALDAQVDVPESFAAGWRACIRQEQRQRQARKEIPGVFTRLSSALRGAWRGWMPRTAAYACCAAVLLGLGAQLGSRIWETEAPEAAQYSMMSDYAAYDGGAYGGMADGVNLLGRAASGAERADEKIVRTASITMNAQDMDAAIAALREQVEALGGSVLSSEVSGTQDEDREAYLDIRVPSSSLEELLGGVQAVGEVTAQRSSAVDMTDSYRDNASRLESARAKKQRLDELYAQAQDMEDIIAVTEALFDVQAEIDSLEGANRDIDARSDDAQVHVILKQSRVATQAQMPLPERLLVRLADGVQALLNGVGELALAAAYLLPTLAALLAIGLAARRIFGRRGARKK